MSASGKNDREWDVGIMTSSAAGTPYARIQLPAEIGRALIAKSLFRAKVSITDGGILVVPYVSEPKKRGPRRAVVDLPEWGT